MVRQIVTRYNGWHSQVLAVYDTFSDARDAVKKAVDKLRSTDPNCAVRELDCVFGERGRTGWCSSKFNYPLGQFIIIAV